MSSHALHSPNITAEELAAYYAAPAPERSRHSLIEISNHNPFLLNFLAAPLDGWLIRELARSAASVIAMPKNANSKTLTPSATPAKGTFAQQQRQQQARTQPSSPADVPLERFIVVTCMNSKSSVRTLLYALLVLDRLREKLPPMAQGTACSGHRLFLVSLVVASKYLNDCTPKNKHWAYWTRGIFQVEEITPMEKQLLGLLQFDLSFTEIQLVQRLRSFIVEQPELKSRGLTIDSSQHIPLTLMTPLSNTADVVKPKPEVARQELVKPEAAKTFVLQPVPTSKKRSDKYVANEQAPTMVISTSQSAPSKIEFRESKHTAPKSGKPTNSYLQLPVFSPIISETDSLGSRHPPFKRSVAMPITRSISSHGVLEGAGSSTMNGGRNLSSTTNFSMSNSSSISTSASASGSEIAAPGDRNRSHFLRSQQGTQEDPHSDHGRARGGQYTDPIALIRSAIKARSAK